jgi:Flp pilus assembly protein TadD
LQGQALPSQGSADGPALAEDSLLARSMNLTFYNDPRGAELTTAPPAARTVSVEQLQHPVSRKGAKLLDQARNFAAMGRHDKAIGQLLLALQERSAIPYAHSMLGVEYIKTGQIPAAIAELEQAIALLPRNVPDHSNLGYALLQAGELDRADTETRQALELDRNNTATQHVLTLILAARRAESASNKP